MPLLISAGYFVLLVLVLADIISRDQSLIRHLPKITWVFIVIFLPLVGSVLWFAVGRDYGTRVEHGRFADSSRFLRAEAPLPVMPQLTDEEIIENEIAFHEKQARIRRLEQDIQSRRPDGRTL